MLLHYKNNNYYNKLKAGYLSFCGKNIIFLRLNIKKKKIKWINWFTF